MRTKKTIGLAIVIAAATAGLGGGCASISKPKVAVVTVKAPQACSGRIECTLTNKKERREVTPTGDVVIRKSDDPLRVACTDAGGNLYHTDEVAGARSRLAWWKVLLGGVIGGIIDASTDARWEYPGTIDVPCP